MHYSGSWVRAHTELSTSTKVNLCSIQAARTAAVMMLPLTEWGSSVSDTGNLFHLAAAPTTTFTLWFCWDCFLLISFYCHASKTLLGKQLCVTYNVSELIYIPFFRTCVCATCAGMGERLFKKGFCSTMSSLEKWLRGGPICQRTSLTVFLPFTTAVRLWARPVIQCAVLILLQQVVMLHYTNLLINELNWRATTTDRKRPVGNNKFKSSISSFWISKTDCNSFFFFHFVLQLLYFSK